MQKNPSLRMRRQEFFGRGGLGGKMGEWFNEPVAVESMYCTAFQSTWTNQGGF